jgi:LysM repeat protein
VTTYVISSSGETTVTSESLDSVPKDIPAGSQDYSQNRQSLQRSFQDSEKGMEFSTDKSIEKGTSTESSEVSVREEKPRTPSFDQTETHIVKVGETLYSISQRYGCSITQLEEWNGLTTTAIRPGQRLKVRLGEQKTSPIGKKSTAAYHTVQKGETYYSIAQKYRTSVRELQQLNGSRNSSLQIGQKIRVK